MAESSSSSKFPSPIEAPSLEAKPTAESREEPASVDGNLLTKATHQQPVPDGILPLYISTKNLEKYGLKAEGGDALVDYKVFSRAEILAEIQKIGFYSDFYNIRDHIKQCSQEEVLVVSDKKKLYGENFYCAVTPEAYNAEVKAVKDIAENQEKIRQMQLEEERRREAEEDALLNVVYEDKPVTSKPYRSDGMMDTIHEVDLLTPHTHRPLMKINIVRSGETSAPIVKFSDKDAADPAGLCESRPHKDPNFELSKLEVDCAIQATPAALDSGTQTSWYRSVNNSIQYTYLDLSPKARTVLLDDPQLVSFLGVSQPLVEQALQQNETLDPFRDEFSWLAEDEVSLGNKHENVVKELRTFTDLVYSRNKCLAAIDWHPLKKGVLAVTATSSAPFEHRVETSGKAMVSYLLIWNFRDLIHPQLVLEAPSDANCFKFHPTMPHLIVAGSTSGQVLLWDISQAESSPNSSKPKQGRGGTLEEEAEAEKTPPPIRASSISHVDHSHRRPVADLAWLPNGMEVNANGNVHASSDENTYQFVTIAADGQTCFWDIRYRDQAAKNPRLYNRKPNKDGTMPEIIWIPIYRTILTKIEGVGEFLLCRLTLFPSSVINDAHIFSTHFLCGTEEGELVCADWKPHSNSNQKKSHDNENEKPSADKQENADPHQLEHVLWTSQDHFRPCIALDRSPFVHSVVLSVGDWSFNLWKDTIQTPIFSSPLASTYLSAGVWSPTRPSVIMIGKVDGTIDVWDLSDQSHKPSVAINVGPYAIRSMQFWASSTTLRQQLLAVGDASGNLHVLEIPRNLWKSLPNEQAFMQGFVERETHRVEYLKFHSNTRDGQASALAGAIQGGSTEAEHSVVQKSMLAPALKVDEHLEAEYEELEAKFKLEFGVSQAQKV